MPAFRATAARASGRSGRRPRSSSGTGETEQQETRFLTGESPRRIVPLTAPRCGAVNGWWLSTAPGDEKADSPMLQIGRVSSKTCQGVTRRELLQVGVLSVLGLSLADCFQAETAQ